MTDKQETIADIIAEIRALSNPISDGIIAINGRSIADRLEAAHKREVREAVTDCNQFGDCAKLREALMYLFNLIDMRKLVLDCDETEEIYAVQVMLDECRAALSAPPRNCEKYTTVDEAMYDYADEALIEEWNALKAGKDRDMLAEELFAFTKWLFAPATEQEGGAND